MLQYFDLFFSDRVLDGRTVTSPVEMTNGQGDPGYWQLTVSPAGFIRVSVDLDAGESLATFVTWLEDRGFTGAYFPETIQRVTDVWVTDLATAVTFRPIESPEEPVT